MSVIPVLSTHRLPGSISRCVQLKAKREASKQMSTLFHSFSYRTGARASLLPSPHHCAGADTELALLPERGNHS